jgi:hypothetical protein
MRILHNLMLLIALAALSFTATALCATEPAPQDLQGNSVSTLAGPGVRVVVLVFGATDCPISNRYVPEIARLRKLFGAPDTTGTGPVRFWWVYPNAEDTTELIKAHNQEFQITEDQSLGTLRDIGQTLARKSEATTTPEAAVFVVEKGTFRLVYHGRIDDHYRAIGEERPKAEHHELEEAIAAALAGKAVPQPGGPPAGCAIIYDKK